MVVPSSSVLAVVFGAASHRVTSLPRRQRAVVVLRPLDRLRPCSASDLLPAV
jgi:hypothetical protein